MKRVVLLSIISFFASCIFAQTRPNIVLILTDDQGYGDFSCMGNPVMETPHIDKMAERSVAWDQFYVSPVCSPTRASLMTGRYNHRTKCIDTWLGRSMVAPDETTIAELLRDAGYATAIFGKWHLGDNYPMRPSDQGFEESVVLRGGGMGQPADPRDSHGHYTNPVLLHNNHEQHYEGYCTDVYFDLAGRFMDKARAEGRPFFTYIACNAPHSPFNDVPEDLYQYYLKKGTESLIVGTPKNRAREIDNLARIAAMVTNIDDNVGQLFEKLKADGIYDNTIVLFLTDNGPNTRRYVRHLRGKKSEPNEGGVRTPLWIHWPAQLKGGTVVKGTPAAHIDLAPTLLDACGVVAKGVAFDGRSLLPQLKDPSLVPPERSLVLQFHRGDNLIRYHNCMLRNGKWKMVNPSGTTNRGFKGAPAWELYNLDKDPGEKNDLAASNTEVLKQLVADYDRWFGSVSEERADQPGPLSIWIDREKENPVVLTWQDAFGGQWSIKHPGKWKLDFKHSGRIDVRVEMPQKHTVKEEGTICKLNIGGKVYSKPVAVGEEWAVFEAIRVDPGEAWLSAVFQTPTEIQAAYHVRLMHR